MNVNFIKYINIDIIISNLIKNLLTKKKTDFQNQFDYLIKFSKFDMKLKKKNWKIDCQTINKNINRKSFNLI